ncbi:MAG: hypothetical protein RBU45_16515 [Myxococcota bacterium]|nr:hypothetical protein [Myxococcota bacterium]
MLPGSCANHPERAAAAICVSCRKAVCAECATQWDGLHHCVACLARRREQARGPKARLSWLGLLLLIPALTYLGSWALVWTTLRVAELLE